MYHVWISQGEGMKSCLTCGGLWTAIEDAYGELEVSIDGEPATPCTGNTNSCHHYSGECPVDKCELDPYCNCLSCHS